uniref:Docking protein 2 n=1 Tax=Podarcis muralis TaxID=64176 RepID=A0A670J5F1_PODMU
VSCGRVKKQTFVCIFSPPQKWRRFWAVLYRESACAPARLELLESVEKAKKGDSSRRIIKLEDCVQVAEAGGETGSPKETVPFFLETTEKFYLLAAERAEAEAWILELCKHAFTVRKMALSSTGHVSCRGRCGNQDLFKFLCFLPAAERQFPVAVRATEASERCQIWGMFFLCAKADALELQDKQAGEVIYTWPYKFLRRFGHDKVMAIFSFEAGRRCASGEGSFEFATKQGSEIIQVIEGAINAQRNSSSASSVATLLAGAASPAKPVEGPTASCPLSSTNCPYMEGSDAHPRREPQQESMSEYSEPFDAISKSLGRLGLSPASLGLHHIYDDPEGLAHLVYDEPQEFTGDAWKVQATPEDPIGHEYPYNPSLDDYSVPKMAAAYAPVQDQNGLGESAYDQVILSLKNKKNAQ